MEVHPGLGSAVPKSGMRGTGGAAKPGVSHLHAVVDGLGPRNGRTGGGEIHKRVGAPQRCPDHACGLLLAHLLIVRHTAPERAAGALRLQNGGSPLGISALAERTKSSETNQ